MQNKLDIIKDSLNNLFFETCCVICKQDLLQNMLCTNCFKELKFITNACEYCAKPYKGNCMFCPKEKNVSYSSSLLYNDICKKIIGNLKFYGDRKMMHIIEKIVVPETLHLKNKVDIIIPVPLHPFKLFLRGFNQSYLIARAISNLINVNVDDDILYKVKHTRSQTSLSRSQRIINLKNAFIVKKSVEGKTILLVDDVLSTGSTIGACIKALNFAKYIHVFTLAKRL